MVNNPPKETIEMSDLGKIVDYARLYYEKNMDQKQIAKLRKVSQSEVSRVLKEARKKQIIKTTISAGYDLRLESRLIDKYKSLKEVIISYVPRNTPENELIQTLGREGAEYFLNTVQHTNRVGLSCGRTLNSVVRNLEETARSLNKPLPELCRVYALTHPCIDEIVDPTPASIVSSALTQLPQSIGYAYQFPTPDEETKNTSLQELFGHYKKIKKLKENMETLDVYFVGIGHTEMSPAKMPQHGVGLQFNALIASLSLEKSLKEFGAVGEIDFQPYDRDGNNLIYKSDFQKLKDNILYLPLEILKERVKNDNVRVVGIGGGDIKRKAILGALKGKMINTLITDSFTATKLIQEK